MPGAALFLICSEDEDPPMGNSTKLLTSSQNLKMVLRGGGGCNPKKPYPSLTFSRVGVGFFWVLLFFSGFFGFLKN